MTDQLATEPTAYTIREWCRMYNICRATFYNMKKAGKAPRTIRPNKHLRITIEADLEWRKAKFGVAA